VRWKRACPAADLADNGSIPDVEVGTKHACPAVDLEGDGGLKLPVASVKCARPVVEGDVSYAVGAWDRAGDR